MRQKWESEIADLRKQILVREKLLQGLNELEGTTTSGPLSKIQQVSVKSNLGLTDAVREIFRGANRELSATEVRDQLLSSGFEPRSGSNFLVMIHSTLARLAKANEIKKETNGGKRVYAARLSSSHADTKQKHPLVVLPPRSLSQVEDEQLTAIPSAPDERNALSRRDKVELIVKLRSEGKTNKEIANTIGMDTHAFKCYLTTLFKRGLLQTRPPGRPVRNAG